MLTQCRLYRELTGDNTYAEMEASINKGFAAFVGEFFHIHKNVPPS